jgi:hypothetical protein
VPLLGFVLLAFFATPASAADVPISEEVAHPSSDRTYPVKLSCGRCGGGLPWGGLRKSYSSGLAWGGLRSYRSAMRRSHRVVLVRKG